ncbi:hypothetical protein CROQUDRAFT_651926 [Cronartium quercuum f. sp. fusiforme G11]|uniref:TOG domain-containing protein n=1 Tax=Cronartium quercuum f. sp. fusiforme G11 TaxID=708437 RepID=A0A9P6THE6_9BASI|nr:hypothetical protein CROQUDRAFT_651926 [Cronartium quercuum f. sp. fusiforme G11]
MSHSGVQALALALSGSDNERKTTSLAGLKDELETPDVVPDHATILPLVKTALESSNGHVSFAALSCIPAMVKNLVTHDHQTTLKQTVAVLYAPPSGSVIGFLGDSKPRVRETARSALLAAATAACEAHLRSAHPPSGPNEVLQELERIAKEQGFANKVPRARVQILHYVRDLRSRYPTVVQLKTYLPSMVSLLEDPDASVRSSALETIVTVFQDSSISPTARAGLKSELAKQAIRKATVEAILPKVFESQKLPPSENPLSRTGSLSPPQASSSGRSHSDERALIASVTTPRIPASDLAISSLVLTSSATDGSQSGAVVQPIYITSGREMEIEFSKMLPPWEGKETEHNWQAREGNVAILRGMIKSGAHLQFTADFVAGLKVISDGLLKSLATLRTTMAVAACTFLQESASLGIAFDPLLDVFLPPLLRMAAQTKKIVFQASQAAATAFIQATSYNTRTIQFLLTCVNEKTIQARAAGISRIKEFIEVHGHRSKVQIESGGGLGLIDKALKRALSDASPAVRQTAREVYWTCSVIWPGMTEALMETLDGPTRKQLEKASSNLLSSSSTKPTSEPVKRVSVRSMIKSTRTVSGSSSRTAPTERPNAISTPRKSESMLNKQSSNSRVLEACHPNLQAGPSAPDKQQHATPPRHPPLNRSGRHPQPINATTSVSPLRKSLPHRSPASTHFSLRTPQSSKIQASARYLSSSSDHGPQSHLFRAGKSDDENMKSIHQYDLAQLNRHTPMHVEETIVEDAMKAQAEQAESAAHRLLELTEDEFEIGPPVPLGPGGVLLSTNKTEGTLSEGGDEKSKTSLSSTTHDLATLRELNLAKLAKINKLEDVNVWKKTFENSPVQQVSSMTNGSTQNQHLVTDLRNRMRDSWWHRQAELTMCRASSSLTREQIIILVNDVNNISNEEEVKSEVYINLAQVCTEHKLDITIINNEAQEFWAQDRLFDKLFDGLRDRLRDEKVSSSIRDSQLILLRSIILHVGQMILGKETELCALLLSLVQSGTSNVIIACEAIGLLWVEQTDPIYGLSCLRSAMEMMDHESDNNEFNISIRLAVTCVGEYFGRLPIEIVEEELPKARDLIKRALVSQDPETRMSAVMSLVVANGVMKDEKAVMGVLGDLTRAQEALLTYYLTPEQGLLSASDS